MSPNEPKKYICFLRFAFAGLNRFANILLKICYLFRCLLCAQCKKGKKMTAFPLCTMFSVIFLLFFFGSSFDKSDLNILHRRKKNFFLKKVNRCANIYSHIRGTGEANKALFGVSFFLLHKSDVILLWCFSVDFK